ncbi:MAG: Tim44 domain-containing protein, partial [Thermodesulfobacteriota bacterium]
AGGGGSGGKSFGSRGSRTMTPQSSSGVRSTDPSSTRLAPTTPSRNANPYSSRSTDSFWRGLGGGVLGGLAGSYIGRWLFGGPDAQAGPESGDAPGFGLIDLILLAGLGYFIYWLITRRRRQHTAALQGAKESNPAGADLQPPDQELEPPPPPKPQWDLETGLQHIERSDPLFSEPKFKDQAMDYFFKIQGAWMDRDLSTVKHLLTREMFETLREDAEKMRRDGLINRLQNMAVREVNLTEAWQEAGQDYITVRIYVTLLDYTINERSGEIVAGSKTEPIKFEEYWTFTRPVGNHPWQLSAVNQAE